MYGSLMGDFEDDPIFGTHMQSMQQMNGIMNSFFGNPFGMMAPALMGPDAGRRTGRLEQPQQQQQQQQQQQRHNSQMMPFGFPSMPPFDINGMFAGNFDNMASGGNCHGMTSTSIVTYTNGPDGRPQIYQASKSTRAAPGGIKEVKESVYDSRAGTKKLAIGHHIGERAHIIEKKKDLNNGDEEEHQEFINLDDEEAESFNQEWQTKVTSHMDHRANRSNRAVEYETTHHRKRSDPKRLALTDGSASQHSSQSRRSRSPRQNIRSLSTTNKNNKTSGNAAFSQGHDENHTKTSTETSTSRKRERNGENEISNKRHMSNSHD